MAKVKTRYVMTDIVRIPLDRGPRSIEPSVVVVHAMAEIVIEGGEGRHAVSYLRREGLSAHIVVTPSGTIIRCRDDNQGAWHARAQGYNYKSLGIEFLVKGAHNYSSFVAAIKTDYLTPQQYEAGVNFCRKEWVENLGILHFAKHSRIDRKKVDPGEGFRWAQFLSDIGLIYKP